MHLRQSFVRVGIIITWVISIYLLSCTVLYFVQTASKSTEHSKGYIKKSIHKLNSATILNNPKPGTHRSSDDYFMINVMHSLK